MIAWMRCDACPRDTGATGWVRLLTDWENDMACFDL